MDAKHFESDYNRLVEHKLASRDRDDAMAESIGGNFSHFGLFQRALLLQLGLPSDGHLLDVGCGSGRLAHALKDLESLEYTGIDVVQNLLDYASDICGNPVWRFVKSTDFKLPLENGSVDMAVAFSLFTHLLHEETYAYLAEMRRVLKPGGRLVFSFLDFSVPEHWTVFASNLAHMDNRVHLNQFISASMIEAWAEHLHLNVDAIHPGDTPYIDLPEPITSDSGEVFSGKVSLGQSLCVLSRPPDSPETLLAVVPDDFDAGRYLSNNPDVAASGMDPKVHYILHGQFENRKW